MSTIDRKGQPTTFEYDPLNRRTQANYADGAVATFTYDAAGRLLQADDTADPHRPIALEYDALDRLLAETTALGTVSYQYDAVGRRTSMTVGGQAPVAYAYDPASRLRTITQAPLNPVDIQYDALGRRTRLTLPNGVSTDYQYDGASRLTNLIYRNALGPLGDLTYQYDAAGNRIAVDGSFARTIFPDPVDSATYDAANRKLALGGKTMSYDANGSLTTLTEGAATTTFTWDARNRLIALAGVPPASFAYDARGRRARKAIAGQAATFQYDALDIVREILDTTEVAYLRGLGIDEPLLRNGSEYYLADALRSTLALTDPTGNVATSYTYAPFGQTAVAGLPSPNPFQYTARDAEGTGLYFYRARYYHPGVSRFINEDPIGLAGADINLYAYVANNPTTYLDPYGLWRFLPGGRSLAPGQRPILPPARPIPRIPPSQPPRLDPNWRPPNPLPPGWTMRNPGLPEPLPNLGCSPGPCLAPPGTGSAPPLWPPGAPPSPPLPGAREKPPAAPPGPPPPDLPVGCGIIAYCPEPYWS